MASPTFNSQKIFDSLDYQGNYFSAGNLYVLNYSPIIQKIHFEGQIGDWMLYHGMPDMPWVFEGLLSATTLTAFNTQIGNIQSATDACMAGNGGTYFTLVDSIGNVYDNSQIRTFDYIEAPHIYLWDKAGAKAFGYVAKIRCTGVVSSATHVGATS